MQKRDDDIIEYRGKWSLSWYDPAGQRKRTSLGLAASPENYSAAQRAADDLRRDLKAAQVADLPDTLSTIYAAYEADKTGRVIKLDDIKNSWKALAPFWGGLRVDQITRENCRKYISQRRAEGKSDGTILKQLGALKAAVRWAKGKSVQVVFEMPSQAEPRDRCLDRAEFFRLLDAAKVGHFVLWLHLAIATAGRKSAILEMTWENNIDFEEGVIRLGVKNVNGARGKARATVPMTPTVRAELEKAYAMRRGPYVIQYNGQRVANIRRAFEDAAARADLKDVTPHDIRHTAAVWMVGAGVPMSKVSQYLGHADTRITERVYARYQPDHLKEAAAALDLGPRLRVVS